MFSKGIDSIIFKDIENIPQEEICKTFLGIDSIPCLIQAPYRRDRNPSVSLYYSKKTNNILFKDLAKGYSGSIYKLLELKWSCTPKEVYRRISRELNTFNFSKTNSTKNHRKESKIKDLKVKIREFNDKDIEYWQSYGISKELLLWANIHPISHYILYIPTPTTFKASEYAYAFFEWYKGNPYIKVYQPFTSLYKWVSKFNDKIISLYDKIPRKGSNLIICSSLKDCLTIIANTAIPCICPQGEGYSIDESLMKNLKERYTNIYVLYDNDEAGIYNGKRIAEEHNIKYIELPKINNSKDPSDLYKSLEDKTKFKTIIQNLIK